MKTGAATCAFHHQRRGITGKLGARPAHQRQRLCWRTNIKRFAHRAAAVGHGDIIIAVLNRQDHASRLA